MFAGLAALVLGLAAHPAQAQPLNQNKVINSGNGAFNNITIRNRAPGFYGPQFPVGYPGAYNPSAYAPQLPVGYPGAYNPSLYSPPQAYPVPGVGGFNFNHVLNSANGQGNNIAIGNGGFSYTYPGGSYGGVTVGGVNVNVITNSGNGVGNTIGIGNH
jgi:hypothetical protein